MGVFVQDTFTEGGSDVFIESHVGETGATWTVAPGSTGQITVDATNDFVYGVAGHVATASGMPSDGVAVDIEIELNFGTMSGSEQFNVYFNSGPSYYNRVVFSQSSVQWLRNSPAGFVSVGFAAYASLAASTTHRLRVSFNNGVMLIYVNGVRLSTIMTDVTPYTTAGNVAFMFGIAATSTAGMRLTKLTANETAGLLMKVGTFNTPTATGVMTVTGIGFPPKALILLPSAQTTPSIQAFAPGIAFVDDANGCRAYSASDQHGAATTVTREIESGGRCFQKNSNTGTTEVRAISPTLDIDGFSMNFDTVNAGVSYVAGYIALGGADLERSKVTGCDTPTATNSALAYTGVGFQGNLGFFLSTGIAGNITNSQTFHLRHSLGIAKSSTNRYVQSMGCENAQATTDTCSQLIATKVIQPVHNTVLLTSADFVSWDSDGFTLNWSTVSGASGMQGFALILKGNFRSTLGVDTSRTSSAGTKSTTGVGFQPQYLMAVSGNKAAATTVTAQATRSIGAYDGTTQLTTAMMSFDNVADGAGQHFMYTGGFLFQIRSAGGISWSGGGANVQSLDSGGFTLDWDVGVDATARQFIYLALASAPAAQSVTPTAASATATAIAPTASTTGGSQTVTPGVAAATANAITPTATPGTATLIPQVATASASGSAPTATGGAVTSTPGSTQATATAIAPTATPGTVTGTPASTQATASATAPSVSVGTATATPTTAIAIASASAPAVTAGDVSLMPTVAIATGSVTAPDPVIANAAEPTVAAATASATAPTITVGGVSQTPGTAAATATAIAPDITGAISQATGTAIASAAAIAPDVTNVATAAPTTAAGVATVDDVTVILGGVSQSPAVAAATASASDATATPGTATMTPGVAEALAGASAPIITTGGTTATPASTSATATAIDVTATAGESQSAPTTAGAIATATDVSAVAGAVSTDPTTAAAMASVIDVDAFITTSAYPEVAEAVATASAPTVAPGETMPSPDVAIALAMAGDTTAIGMVNLAPGVAVAMALTDDPEVFTCPDIEIDPHGREGIGVVQPQSGINYPFVKPSEDIQHLIADLYLAYEDPSDYTPVTAYELPLKIAYIYGLGCTMSEKPLWAPDATHYVDVVITDADDQVVFDSTQADYFEDLEWGEYKIFEWRTDEGVLRIVSYVSWPDTDEPAQQQFPKHIAPDNGILDARTIYRMPKRVKSLRLVLDQFTKTNVNLVAGYNMSLVHETADSDPGERNVEQITINATPGAGDGIFPGCVEQDIVLRRINGVGPNLPGDFLLAATDCYWVRQPTTIVDEDPLTVVPAISLDPTSGHLQLGNDCGPCCSCDDFVDTVKYMYRLRDEGIRIGKIVDESRDQYHLNRERWNEAKECLEKRPLRLALQAQNCPYLDVVAQYCNQTDKCLKDIVLIIRFSTLPEIEPSCACEEEEDPACDDPVDELPDNLNEAVKVVCGHTVISGGGSSAKYKLDGKWCEYRAYFDAIDPFSSVSVRFRLEFPNAGQAIPEGGTATAPYAVSGCLRASVGGKWLCIPPGDPQSVAVDRQTASLECPASDSTC